jgi:hypothetical protein
MNKNIYKQIIEEKAWCSAHPTGYIGRDQTGHWYNQCRQGYLRMKQGEKPNCEIIIEKGGEKQSRFR